MRRRTQWRRRRAIPGWAGLVLLLTLAAALTVPELLGYRLLAVQTDSMNPTIHAGDLVIGRPPKAQSIQPGTVITFRNPTGQLVTHRVIQVQETGYVTKGDANSSPDDQPVGAGAVVSIYGLRIPRAGFLAGLLRGWTGLLFLVILPGTLLVATESMRIWNLLRQGSAPQHGEERSVAP